MIPLPRHALPCLAVLVLSSAAARAQQTTEAGAQQAAAAVDLVTFKGGYADLAEMGSDLTALLIGGGTPPKSFYEMRDKLEGIADGEAREVLFDLTAGFAFNGAQIAELERSIRKIRAAGKTCYAYVENAGATELQIAALCDKVLMAELGLVDLPSLSMSVTFLKDAMDLLGVQMDVVRCGDFKGAVEPYVLSSMSDHLRRHYEAMLEKMNSDVVARIARGRGIADTAVRAMQAQRVLRADEARSKGLVDVIVPWQGAEHALSIALGRDDVELRDALGSKKEKRSVNPMQLLTQLLNPRRDDDDDEDDRLAVLHLSGAIVDGTSAAPGSIVSGPTVETIRKLTDSEHVKGVVVRINSPGGSATASEAILLALRDLAAKKPVAVSMGRVAASGGYYVTCFGRPIFAEAGTLTGSIGVFGMKPNIGTLMRRIGIHDELVCLDASASMNSLDRPWSDDQRERIQGFVNKIYDVFVGHVATSRGLTTSEVLAIAGGRVWSGEQARERGLVDHIGGVDAAVALVAKEAGLSGDYDVRHLPQPKSFFEAIAGEMFDAKALWPDLASRAIGDHRGLDHAMRLVLDALRDRGPAKAWALLPETFEIR